MSTSKKPLEIFLVDGLILREHLRLPLDQPRGGFEEIKLFKSLKYRANLREYDPAINQALVTVEVTQECFDPFWINLSSMTPPTRRAVKEAAKLLEKEK